MVWGDEERGAVRSHVGCHAGGQKLTCSLWDCGGSSPFWTKRFGMGGPIRMENKETWDLPEGRERRWGSVLGRCFLGKIPEKKIEDEEGPSNCSRVDWGESQEVWGTKGSKSLLSVATRGKKNRQIKKTGEEK